MALQFSVVIPTFNRKAALRRCLESLSRQTLSPLDFEVIVVDDGSTDGTAATLEGLRFPFHYTYFFQPNGGPSSARNLGISRAQGVIVAFTEDDVEVRPDWLQNALACFDEGTVGLLEGRTVYSHSGKDIRRFEGTSVHSFVPCNLFIRRDILSKVGGYDPDFYDPKDGLYFREDADLGFRILDRGTVTRIASDVVVEHPLQFTRMAECLRHARRYVFDPLLYKRHPQHFRQMIEVKEVFGLTVHRPQHYLALFYFVTTIGFALGLVCGSVFFSTTLALVLFVSSLLFRYKYQGARAVRIYRLGETLGFLALPIVYLVSFARGCVRFKSFGAFL